MAIFTLLNQTSQEDTNIVTNTKMQASRKVTQADSTLLTSGNFMMQVLIRQKNKI